MITTLNTMLQFDNNMDVTITVTTSQTTSNPTRIWMYESQHSEIQSYALNWQLLVMHFGPTPVNLQVHIPFVWSEECVKNWYKISEIVIRCTNDVIHFVSYIAHDQEGKIPQGFGGESLGSSHLETTFPIMKYPMSSSTTMIRVA